MENCEAQSRQPSSGKAYEYISADTALASQSCSCCHGNPCRGRCGTRLTVCRNTSDSQLAFCRIRVLARACNMLGE